MIIIKITMIYLFQRNTRRRILFSFHPLTWHLIFIIDNIYIVEFFREG